MFFRGETSNGCVVVFSVSTVKEPKEGSSTKDTLKPS